MNARVSRFYRRAHLRALLLLAFAAAMHPAPAASTSPAPEDSMAGGLPTLRDGYVGFTDLQVRPGDTLADAERRSQGRISVTLAGPQVVLPPVISTLLPDGTIYCRMASFNAPGGWASLATQFRTWAAQGTPGLILDLRSTAVPDDFAGAVAAAGLFLPAGAPLFTVRDAHATAKAYLSENPAPAPGIAPVSGPIVVLINAKTSGAAEALAAALQAHGALTLGRWTSGNGAEFADLPLASGHVLHYVCGDVTMADGTPLWRHPVGPDIGLLVDAAKEDIVLGLIGQNKVLDVLRESAGSHRLSEAALVRGEDPALDAYLVPVVKPRTPAAMVTEDSVLVAALDSLKAIRVSLSAPAAATAD